MIEQKTVRTTLAQKRAETRDCVTLRLDPGGEAFDYKPGMAVDVDPHQFGKLAERIRELEARKGKTESSRGFSISSSPLEGQLIELTVKLEAGGLLTPFLVRELREGEPVEIAGPYGLFTMPDTLDPAIDTFVYVAAGSGITPNRGILRHCFAKGSPLLKHALFYQNQSPDDAIFRKELDEIARAHSGRVKIVHAFSKTDGRHLTLDVLRRELDGFADPSRCLGFVCGPNRPRPDGAPGFIDLFAGIKRKNQPGILGHLGFSFDRIKTELW